MPSRKRRQVSTLYSHERDLLTGWRLETKNQTSLHKAHKDIDVHSSKKIVREKMSKMKLATIWK